MNTQELQDKIKELEDQLNQLKELANKADENDWRDKLVQPDREGHHYIDGYTEHGYSISWENHSKIKPEHAFKTFEQAELMAEKMLLMQEMHAFAHVRNEGWEPDWESYSFKYGVSIYRNSAYVVERIDHNDFAFGVAVKSEKIAEEMLEVFGERVEKIYNRQY